MNPANQCNRSQRDRQHHYGQTLKEQNEDTGTEARNTLRWPRPTLYTGHPQCSKFRARVSALAPLGNKAAGGYVAISSEKSIRQAREGRSIQVATDYDEVRSDVKESQERSLEDLQSANAPGARSVVTELEETDALDEGLTPGGEIISDELIVQVIPQGDDEFTCYSCFLVRHRSQVARESNGHSYCIECEG